MNYRLFFVGSCVLAAIGFDMFLLVNEELVEPDAKTKAEQPVADQMFNTHYTPAEREGNIRKMGFDADETARIVKQIGSFEDKYKVKDPTRNQVAVKIQQAEDEDELRTAFCGTATSLPVRYAAMPFLLQEKDGQIKIVDIDEISAFQYNRWAETARISAGYQSVDLAKDRKADATRMVMAAIIGRKEDLLIEHKDPWGSGVAFFSGWSWDGVKRLVPGIDIRLYDYVALMHLVLEVAASEGGLCAT